MRTLTRGAVKPAAPSLGSDRLRWCLQRCVAEREAALRYVHLDPPALAQLAEEHLVREHALDLRLDEARHRPRAEVGIVAALGEPAAGGGGQLDGDAASGELRVELGHELVDDALDGLRRERCEGDDRVEAVSELGAEETLERLLALVAVRDRPEADGRRRHLLRP